MAKVIKISVCKCETILPFDLDFVFAILIYSGNVCLLVLTRHWLISAPDIWERDILTRTFHHRDFLVGACFGPAYIPKVNFFHICKWIFFAILIFAITGKRASGVLVQGKLAIG